MTLEVNNVSDLVLCEKCKCCTKQNAGTVVGVCHGCGRERLFTVGIRNPDPTPTIYHNVTKITVLPI